MIDWFNRSGGEGMGYKSVNNNQNLVEIMFFVRHAMFMKLNWARKNLVLKNKQDSI